MLPTNTEAKLKAKEEAMSQIKERPLFFTGSLCDMHQRAACAPNERVDCTCEWIAFERQKVFAPSEEVERFDGSVQFELDFGIRRIRVNCPDEDDDIYIQVKAGKQYAGISLSLDEAEQLANYILGHVKNARISNP